MKTLFPLLLILFFSLIHILAYTRIVRRLHIKQTTRSVFRMVLIANMAGIIGYVASRYAISPPWSLYFLFSLSIGIGFALFIGGIVYELLHLLQRLIPFSPEKRAFFKRSSDLGFLAAGSAYLGAGIAEGAKDPALVFVDVPQNRFAHPYRIVQISDLHIGGLIDRDFVRRSVETINALEPDLIAITGDLSDAHIETISEAVGELRHLRSRYGTFYVVGNHEYFHSLEATIEYVKSLGIRVLENESVPIDGGAFYVVGVNDIFGYRTQTHAPDLARALHDVPSDVPTLLLAHQPKFVEYLAGFVPSLMLCGHTHGGQIWPFRHLVSLQQPYVKGLHERGAGSHLYVNSGIGFWGPPMRLGSQAEITCITWS